MTEEPADRVAVEALREQALIEEARWRARRRRRGYAVAALVGLAIAVGLGSATADRSNGGFGRHDRLSLASVAGGGQIVLADGSATLRVVNPDGSGLRPIARCPVGDAGCGILEPAWSPDGERLAFIRGLRPGPRSLKFGLSLYVMDGAAGHETRLAFCGTCGLQNGGHLAWSPDGTLLAFSRDRVRGERYESPLWIADAVSGQLRQLTRCTPAYCADVQPDWSPDGRLILFRRISNHGDFLYTVHPDGSQLTELNTSAAGEPQWSPNGRMIAFDGGDTMFVAAADGSRNKLLLAGDQGSGPGAPSWSPDSSRLAYVYTPGVPGMFTAELWTMNIDGSHRRRVAKTGCCVETMAPPIWSPEGKQIAFAADSAGGTFVVNADGTGRRQLSPTAAIAISWQHTR
jgi:Tol biopolymer transport system component